MKVTEKMTTDTQQLVNSDFLWETVPAVCSLAYHCRSALLEQPVLVVQHCHLSYNTAHYKH